MRLLGFVARHSAWFMILSTLFGFLLPQWANYVLPYLPIVLFFLMMFTLLGIKQPLLLRELALPKVWGYAFLHTLGMSVVFVGAAWMVGLRGDLLLAIAAVMATGSLFATPAIVRSIGFDPLYAMALTIATTLLMPVVLFINLWCFQTDQVALDMGLYTQRLLIFIAGPMVLSAFAHRFISAPKLELVHRQLSKVTILLVMSFPFGLIGTYRHIVDTQLRLGLGLLVLSVILVLGLFALNFWLYQRHPLHERVSTAVASGGRNVLLTLTIAGPFLGERYLPLIGAMQFPIYALPLLTRAWMKFRARHFHVHHRR